MFGFGKKKAGVYKEYYSNGNIKNETSYQDGLLHGPFKSWQENGNLEVEGQCHNGLQFGIITAFHENGIKSSQIEYDFNTVQIGNSTSWYDNGQMSGTSRMVNGLAEGVLNSWHKNGQKSEEASLKDGRRFGKSTNWDENGLQKRRGTGECRPRGENEAGTC